MKQLNESRWFEEGRQANLRGEGVDANPYAEGSPKWYIWNEGYNVTL